MNIKQLYEKTANGFKEFMAKVELSNVIGLAEELTKYIKKGTTNKTFILDNGERAIAIVDIDDEVEYDADSLHIDFITSDDANFKIVHINSATQDRAGLMSAADKKIIDKAVLEGSDTSLNLIEDIEDIIGDSAEGLNISNLNGISALDNNNISVNSMLDIREGMRVEDNKLASFGSRGILLNQGGIDFQYATNISHLVNSKAVNANYENGIACKEAFYVEDKLTTKDDIKVVKDDKKVIIDNDKIIFINDSTTHDTEGTISYNGDTDVMSMDTFLNVQGLITAEGGLTIGKEQKLSFKYGNNKESNITVDNVGIFNFSDSINVNGNIKVDSELEIVNDGILLGVNNEFGEVYICNEKGSFNVDKDTKIDGTLTATEVDTQKLLCSQTTDKVTESSSVTKDNINVSYSGNNIDNSTTMTKDGITVSSEDSFTGTSKGSYQAGGLSVSNTDTDGVKSSVSVSPNKITFTEKEDSFAIIPTISHNPAINNSLDIDGNIICSSIYSSKSNPVFNINSLGIFYNIKYYSELSAKMYIEPNGFRFIPSNDINLNMSIGNISKGIDFYQNEFEIENVNYKVEVKHTLNCSSIKYTKIDDTNVVKKVYSDPNQIYISNKTSKETDKINIEPTGINLYVQDKNNNNNINTYLDADKVAIETTNTNTNITNNIELNRNGLLLQKSNVDKDFINADITNQTLEINEFNSITIENTNASTNKDIDIKNYDVLINDNSRLGFKYNNEIYVFNAQKAIELGLLTKA